ncbi:hypothetical protein ACVR0O_07690 [Streptococcus caviae]|uniref:hypothetical protein n=1 Tax=Streptococcus sp. 'caviae' TaxID=1915004 RepID=UPI00094B8E75|nr:hypothetical protein [Streptococcus sp. 'caviae']OLN83010.1 hypothetical protein BMI76_07055 [Streptococcus sp. 'caviae']
MKNFLQGHKKEPVNDAHFTSVEQARFEMVTVLVVTLVQNVQARLTRYLSCQFRKAAPAVLLVLQDFLAGPSDMFTLFA